MKRKIVDRSSGDKIGELIFTLQNTGKQLEVLDIDIILANETASRIRFETLKEQSDSNEYYEVSTIDQDAHLIIETVNRFTESDKLIDTERDVHISMFPFQVNLFENMDGFNNGVLIYPFLWAKECNIETASKKISPLSEIIKIYFGFKKEFNL